MTTPTTPKRYAPGGLAKSRVRNEARLFLQELQANGYTFQVDGWYVRFTPPLQAKRLQDRVREFSAHGVLAEEAKALTNPLTPPTHA